MTKITTECENSYSMVYQFQHLSEGVLFVFVSDPSKLCMKFYDESYVCLDGKEAFCKANNTDPCYFVNNVHITYSIIK